MKKQRLLGGMKGGWYIVNMNKSCRKCGVELKPKVNFAPSQVKRSNFICYGCLKPLAEKWRKKYPEKKKQSDANYYKNNTQKLKNKAREYQIEHKEHYSKLNYKLGHSIPSGVYFIYYKNQIIYIGQSKTPYRRITQHFSVDRKQGRSNRWEEFVSPIAKDIAKGILNKKFLSFELKVKIEDKNNRLKIEQEFINEHQPEYNQKGKARLY